LKIPENCKHDNQSPADIFPQGRQFSLDIANSNPVGSGTRAMEQANDFTGMADDATTVSWNSADRVYNSKNSNYHLRLKN